MEVLPIVKEIQALLVNRGYTLTIDGKAGPKTFAAIKAVLDVPPGPYTGPRITRAGPDFDKIVKHYEQKVNEVYVLDGVAHAGYGHVTTLPKGTVVSDAQVNEWFAQDKALAEGRLLKRIASRLNQKQFDAIASIIWNGGDGTRSPLFYPTQYGVLASALNSEDWALASKIIVALGKKPTATGQVFRGIERRRLTEDELFRGVPYTLR